MIYELLKHPRSLISNEQAVLFKTSLALNIPHQNKEHVFFHRL